MRRVHWLGIFAALAGVSITAGPIAAPAPCVATQYSNTEVFSGVQTTSIGGGHVNLDTSDLQ